jgi:transcriptional regulator with XRE-family HTH domain
MLVMGKYDPAPTVAAGLIRTARDRASLTQWELAELAAVTQQTVSAYETGRKEPTLPTLQRLLAAAGFELRVRLEPIDRHDQALQVFLDSLPAESRVELEQGRRARAAAARLRRVKGR